MTLSSSTRAHTGRPAHGQSGTRPMGVLDELMSRERLILPEIAVAGVRNELLLDRVRHISGDHGAPRRGPQSDEPEVGKHRQRLVQRRLVAAPGEPNDTYASKTIAAARRKRRRGQQRRRPRLQLRGYDRK